jgi:hypothetical protein
VRFHATIEKAGKTATGIEVPEEVVSGLGGGKRPKVSVTIRGYTYRSSIAPMSGRFMLPVSAEVREGAGVAGGDEVDIDIEIDAEPREIEVPADLAEALDRDAAAKQVFNALSYSRKQRLVLPIEAAKTAETRQRRITKAVEALRDGKA